MTPRHNRRTNIGVGIGVVLQAVAFILIQVGDPDGVVYAPPLILISIPVFIWGCMGYAAGKGHSKWVGLVGLAGTAGLLVLIILPERGPDGSLRPLQVRKLVALVLMFFGLAVLMVGRRLDDQGYLSIWTGAEVRVGPPWPGACMALGVCIVIVSLVLLLADDGRQGDE